MSLRSLVTFLLAEVGLVSSTPAQLPLSLDVSHSLSRKAYDVQAHRGGRGSTVESVLPSFAWALIDGATTLELDNGITADGVVIVWHDENIVAQKCQDTQPAFQDDPMFPYVGKYVANLTLAQIRTLDCGSKRQRDYPQQLTYPGTRISTLQEVFDFVECADPTHQILWNIESKVDARCSNCTKEPEMFARLQQASFAASPYHKSITYQSFDWRTLVAMRHIDPSITISALIDDDTALTSDENYTTPWLAGLRLDTFPGPTSGHQVAQAAQAISADILSPSAESFRSPEDLHAENYVPFATKAMINEAHRLGLKVKPWTVNRLDVVEQLVEWNVDGIITDYPGVVRRYIKQQMLPVAPKHAKRRVFDCLSKHMSNR
ncbi:PLC-like phosphodiesterase [Coniophora puteana RWD-64-598 SS2]|uniref:PLC-like phosphodiesterase n=1 Tax=Coniophora puteana (strain RWD-64-598) TaxID=741705 RepID=A0A5M3N529_CONPW|nr:PLC-like phosphodiesterase [Coniophora puteana RWD-64-598 SS2]EIW86408.1 PLC-like phosphodiesterase [Coniophora puteana RWD-64-598 SS2]